MKAANSNYTYDTLENIVTARPDSSQQKRPSYSYGTDTRPVSTMTNVESNIYDDLSHLGEGTHRSSSSDTYDTKASNYTVTANIGRGMKDTTRSSPKNEQISLHYYGYRYYDPVTGRWPSRDPLGDVMFYQNIIQKIWREESPDVAETLVINTSSERLKNLYAFLDNNALVNVDYLGLAVDCDGNTSATECCRWTKTAKADATQNYTKIAILRHKMNRANPAAQVVWTDPCKAAETAERIKVTARPMSGGASRAGGEAIVGRNGVMNVFSRWALLNNAAKARAASSAEFCCCEKP